MISSRAQSGLSTLIGVSMIFLIFLFATPVIFDIISINDPGGATGFVIKIAPGVILLILLVRFLRTSSQGRILG